MFPDVRETGETPLRQCQLVMLRMLKILDHLCEKHGIRYFLIGGSLLGAIRHQGFIPWDDDLDVGMRRSDYEKFVRYAVPELPNDIFFQNHSTDIYYPATDFVEARLRDKYSSYHHTQTENNKWHEGLQVDIFVYDRSFLPHNFFIITQNCLLKLLNNGLRRARILKWLSKRSPFSLVYASNYLQNFGLLNLGGNYFMEGEISPLIKAKFEDIEAYIPNGWNACLKRQYGDYMKLPPEEKRLSNHDVVGNAFRPCNHTETLCWTNPPN